MTETIKSKLNGFLLTLIISLLSFIAGGLVYLIKQNDERMSVIEQEQKDSSARQKEQDRKLQNVIWAQLSDPDTSEEMKRLLLSQYVEVTRQLQ